MSESVATPGEEYTVITVPKEIAAFEEKDLPVVLHYVDRPEASLQHRSKDKDGVSPLGIFNPKILDATIVGTAGKTIADFVMSDRIAIADQRVSNSDARKHAGGW